jgi:hypothetical protein
MFLRLEGKLVVDGGCFSINDAIDIHKNYKYFKINSIYPQKR